MSAKPKRRKSRGITRNWEAIWKVQNVYLRTALSTVTKGDEYEALAKAFPRCFVRNRSKKNAPVKWSVYCETVEDIGDSRGGGNLDTIHQEAASALKIPYMTYSTGVEGVPPGTETLTRMSKAWSCTGGDIVVINRTLMVILVKIPKESTDGSSDLLLAAPLERFDMTA